MIIEIFDTIKDLRKRQSEIVNMKLPPTKMYINSFIKHNKEKFFIKYGDFSKIWEVNPEHLKKYLDKNLIDIYKLQLYEAYKEINSLNNRNKNDS